MAIEFEWDDAKNMVNLKKYGISFEEACEIFYGPFLSRIDDRYDYGEIREVMYGCLRFCK